MGECRRGARRAIDERRVESQRARDGEQRHLIPGAVWSDVDKTQAVFQAGFQT